MRWYLQFPISYRDRERVLANRGIQVDHTTLFRWIQAYAPEIDRRIRPHLPHDERIREGGRDLYSVEGQMGLSLPAVDASGQTINFPLSPKRDTAAVRRLFRKALKQPHTVNPRAIAVDKNAAYLTAAKAMKQRGKLRRFPQLRQVKFLNNIVEQDHRRIKRLVRPGLGFTSTPRTIAGYEAMAMIRMAQVVSVPANNMRLSMISLLTYSALLPNLSSYLAFA